MNTFETLNISNTVKYEADFIESETTGKRFASMSLKGRKFTLINTQGDETSLVEEIENKGKKVVIDIADIEAYVVGATPKISRTYYADSYAPGKKMPPHCYSNDGITPSRRVINPESKTCQSCRHAAMETNVEGRKVMACSVKKKLVVIVDDKIHPVDFDTPYLLNLSGGSKINFDEYLRLKAKSSANAIPLPYLKTRISMLETDKDGNEITYSRLGFSPVCVEENEKLTAEIKRFGKSGDKSHIIQEMLGLDEADLPVHTELVVQPEKIEAVPLPEPKKKKDKANIDADIADFNMEETPF